ncbi:MAG: hypothetical protein WBP52_15695 [Terriglobales bacterium]
MPTYSVCDVDIESTVLLPELSSVEYRKPDFTFTIHSGHVHQWDDCKWLHTWYVRDDVPWLFLGRHGDDYLLRFPDLADFEVLKNTKEIFCYPKPETTSDTIRHLLLDQVIPLLLSQQGRLVLHGSAVLTPHGAVAFLGETGRGKSTLASSFSEKGAPVLTDDCLLVKEADGQLLAVPSYQGLRLWPEAVDALFGQETPLVEVAHYTEKKRVDGNVGLSFCTEPAALRRIYFLAPADESEGKSVSIVPLSPRDACMELVKFTYLIDITDRQRLRQEFERLSRLAALPLFYRLSFPRDFSLLPDVHRAILENARG